MTVYQETTTCSCDAPAAVKSVQLSALNTLALDESLCIHCGMCTTVCPHGVFAMAGRRMQVVNADVCMECGACQLNCPAGALQVESGVGCAAAMISAALRGSSEVTCGGDFAPTDDAGEAMTGCGGEAPASSCGCKKSAPSCCG